MTYVLESFIYTLFSDKESRLIVSWNHLHYEVSTL